MDRPANSATPPLISAFPIWPGWDPFALLTSMIPEEFFNPAKIGFLGANRQMAIPHQLSSLLKQRRLPGPRVFCRHLYIPNRQNSVEQREASESNSVID